jgi:hypothetical protein
VKAVILAGFCFLLFYETLDSTLPLPVLIGFAEDAPADVRDAAALLRCTNLFLIEVAARHPSKRQDQWLYVYHEDKLTTRISMTEKFSPPTTRPRRAPDSSWRYTALPTGLCPPRTR